MGIDCYIYAIGKDELEYEPLDRWWVFSSEFSQTPESLVSYGDTLKKLRFLLSKPNVGYSAFAPHASEDYARHWTQKAIDFIQQYSNCEFLILPENWYPDDVIEKFKIIHAKLQR